MGGVLDKVKENLSKKKNKLRKVSSYTNNAINELSNILDDVAIDYKAIDNSLGKLEALSLDDNDENISNSKGLKIKCATPYQTKRDY